MASDQLSSTIPATAAPQLQPLQAWLARSGLSGKILAGGAVVGVLAVFLPLLSMSMSMSAPTKMFGGKAAFSMPALSSSQSVMVIQDWRGVLCLLGYLATAALAVVLYPPNGLGQKTLAWGGLGVGGFISLLALWLLAQAFSGSGGMMMGFGLHITVGIGAYLNLLAGAAVAAGGFLKAREEQLI